MLSSAARSFSTAALRRAQRIVLLAERVLRLVRSVQRHRLAVVLRVLNRSCSAARHRKPPKHHTRNMKKLSSIDLLRARRPTEEKVTTFFIYLLYKSTYCYS